MTTQQMKEAMLREHKRDVKLSYVNYGVVAACALIIIGLFSVLIIGTGASLSSVVSGAFGDVNYSGLPTYFKFVIPIAILLTVGYPVYAWWKVSNRPKDIDQLVNYVENGKRVTHLNESKEYKIKLPLLVVNYHTGAVKKFHIVLEGVSKPFLLPVPFDAADQIKDLLNENS